MKEKKYRSVFGYFGSKSKTAHLYPSPWYDTIIEPFAGSAAYSALYYWKKVILCEKDPKVAALWRFLTRPDCVEYVESLDLPKTVKKGQHVNSIVPRSADPGLIRLIISYTNPNGDFRYRFTERGPGQWKRLMRRLRYFCPRISHWEIHEGSYSTIKNQPATWFLDPPYSSANLANRYRIPNTIDYAHLSQWARTRQGQVIVCESAGASWLPFREINARLMKQNGEISVQEMIWTKDPEIKQRELDMGVEI